MSHMPRVRASFEKMRGRALPVRVLIDPTPVDRMVDGSRDLAMSDLTVLLLSDWICHHFCQYVVRFYTKA